MLFDPLCQCLSSSVFHGLLVVDVIITDNSKKQNRQLRFEAGSEFAFYAKSNLKNTLSTSRAGR